ncbi:uncharacterized protein LTR77_008814 [Saxophila tyrrhenica]|uniref:PNPLA domain-containing protein n=1 Tax=Saxophila tyrrhenica TaxID=1690608 RepID=A0AAV9P0C3_9PEZI|nr:hypothetical protein LTR77_008814 [Saxophila tyrrhenica]
MEHDSAMRGQISTGHMSKELFMLSLDGGGVRGLSSLLILQSLMERLNRQNPPKPCDCFDLIGGTSTGGLIAIMLGRLRMSAQEAITAYTELSKPVFTQQRHRLGLRGGLQGRYDSQALEQGVKAMLWSQGYDDETLLKDSSGSPCNVFVTATSKAHKKTVVFSSYFSDRRLGDRLDEVKIWEAARATSAATTFFDPIRICGEDFVDGATGANNPLPTLLTEASDMWLDDDDVTMNLDAHISCLVSIGTGLPSMTKFNDRATGIMQTLADIATDCEKAAEDFQRHHPLMLKSGRFFRFNVDQGLENVGLEEWKRLDDIGAVTRNYLQLERVRMGINKCSKLLKERDSSVRVLRSLRKMYLDFQHDLPTEETIDAAAESPHWIKYTNRYSAWAAGAEVPMALYCVIGEPTASQQQLPQSLGWKQILPILQTIWQDKKKGMPDPNPGSRHSQQGSFPLLYCWPSDTAHYDLPCIENLSDAVSGILWNLAAQLLFSLPKGRGVGVVPITSNASGSAKSSWAVIRDHIQQIPNVSWGTVVIRSASPLPTSDVRALKTTCLGFECIEMVLFLGGSLPFSDASSRMGIPVVTERTEYEGKLKRCAQDLRLLIPVECKESLKFGSVHTRRKEVKAALGNTMRWYREHTNFRRWLEAPASILWIQGKPGSGKSVLAKRILAEILESQQEQDDTARALVADWFYSIRGGPEGMSHVLMLRSLLYEMLCQKPETYESFKALYRRRRRYTPAWEWSAEDLVVLFEKVVCLPEGPPITVVLDGLDESQDGDKQIERGPKIIDLLIRMVRMEDSRLKIIVLSLPHPWIEKKLRRFHNITMQKENAGDITEIITSRLDVLERHMEIGDSSDEDDTDGDFSPEAPNVDLFRRTVVPSSSGSQQELADLMAEIHHSLLHRADGVVLWVILVLQQLLNLTKGPFTFRDLRAKLYGLPSELDELYERLVEDILKSHAGNPTSIKRSQLILTWVIGTSDSRQLTLQELLEAIAIPEDLESALLSERNPIAEERLRCPSWSSVRQHIYYLCGPFVEVQSQTSRQQLGSEGAFQDGAITDETDRVILLHQTARDFLSSRDRAKDLYVNLRTARAFVNEAILRYIDVVLPRQSRPWAQSWPLSRPRCWEQAPAAVDYVDQFVLLPYIWERYDTLGVVERLESSLLPRVYNRMDILTLLRIKDSENDFWAHSLNVSEHLRAASRTWKEIEGYVRHHGPRLTESTFVFLLHCVLHCSQKARTLYWLHISQRLVQLKWSVWFTELGIEQLAAGMVRFREPPGMTFALTRRAKGTSPLDPFALRVQIHPPVIVEHIAKATSVVMELTTLIRKRLAPEAMASITGALDEGRAAVLRPAWTRDADLHVSYRFSVDLSNIDEAAGWMDSDNEQTAEQRHSTFSMQPW